MKFQWPWRKNKDDELAFVVEELESLFQPVKPREDFVRDLRDNLMDRPKPKWLPLPKAGWQLILMIGGGIISLFLLILGGIRLLTNLFNRNKESEQDTQSSDLDISNDAQTES